MGRFYLWHDDFIFKMKPYYPLPLEASLPTDEEAQISATLNHHKWRNEQLRLMFRQVCVDNCWLDFDPGFLNNLYMAWYSGYDSGYNSCSLGGGRF